MDAEGGLMEPVLTMTLPPDPRAARQARDAVSDLPELPSGRLDDVRLLVSELVTNSIRHGSLGALGRVTVRAFTHPDRVRVEVEDSGPGFAPRPRILSTDQTSGWGLYLVDQLASRWGAERADRNCVWFEIDRPPADGYVL